MAEMWQYRRWIWESALSDLRHRYSGSGLGVLWNVINPIIMLGIYTFIFTRMLVPRLSTGGTPNMLFPLYLSCGFLPWITFADGLVRSAHAFLTNAVYLKKVAIPEIVFVAQTSISTLLSMLFAVALLPILALIMGAPPSWSWLLLPPIVVLWQSFGFGLGLFLSTINVFFRDVAQILTVILQIWMWSLPIVYFEDMLPAAYQATLPFNPAYPFVVALRASVLDAWPAPWLWLAMLAWVVIANAAGVTVLVRLRSELRDLL
jgi:lipopolysaccharide transport system permease protein